MRQSFIAILCAFATACAASEADIPSSEEALTVGRGWTKTMSYPVSFCEGGQIAVGGDRKPVEAFACYAPIGQYLDAMEVHPFIKIRNGSTSKYQVGVSQFKSTVSTPGFPPDRSLPESCAPGPYSNIGQGTTIYCFAAYPRRIGSPQTLQVVGTVALTSQFQKTAVGNWNF